MEILCKIRDIYRLTADFEQTLITTHGLCLNQGMLLCTLLNHGNGTSGEIAQKLGLTASNASKVIKSVEAMGLVERTPGQKDKRQMHFVLTPQGQAKIAAVQCDSLIINDELRKCIAI